MVFAIRVDSSMKIGSGHVMRCLTLARQLKSSGAEVFFICCELPGNMIDLIEKEGYVVVAFPFIEMVKRDLWKNDFKHTEMILSGVKKKVDWLIVDHYELDVRWEARLRANTKKIMVIDDLANRKHDCDLLLDHNFYYELENRYQSLVPSYCKQLLGPRYALLRSEFYEARKKLWERDGKVRRILIFFGGSDPTNETVKALGAIKLIERVDITIDVVVGIANPNKEYIQHLCDDMPNAIFYCQVDNMAQLMANADLAIGAGGTTTWERCFLGLPTITVVVADNQIKTTKALANIGVILNLGLSDYISEKELSFAINRLITDDNILKKMSKNCMKFIGQRTDVFSVLLSLMNKNIIR